MFKPRFMIRNTRVLMMVASLGLPGWTHAAETQWHQKQGAEGFTIMVPSINIDALVDDIVMLKSSLRHDKELLSRKVEEKIMTGNESLLSFLLPGGMLYAAYKKSAHVNAKRNYELVSTQLKGITADLVALTTPTGPIMVAQR